MSSLGDSLYSKDSYYTYIYLTPEQASEIPDEIKVILGNERLEECFKIASGVFECNLLQSITGEDVSTSCSDWFIIEIIDE